MNDKKALQCMLEIELENNGPSDTLIYLREAYNIDFANNKTVRAFLREIKEKSNEEELLADLNDFLSNYTSTEIIEIKKAFNDKY